jgi:hypothetical protein
MEIKLLQQPSARVADLDAKLDERDVTSAAYAQACLDCGDRRQKAAMAL